jgi:hypothetical protein
MTHWWCTSLVVGALVMHAGVVSALSDVSFPSGLGVHRDSILLSTITTDTGDFAPGNREFSRFSSPAMCLGAVDVARATLRRSVASQVNHVLRDTVFGGETLPAGAVAVARTCLRRFAVATISARDLPDMFTLALQAGQDSIAHAGVTRQLALASDGAGRIAILQQSITGYLQAEPSRVAAAEAAVARIDAVGPSIQVARLTAHGLLLTFATSSFNVAVMRREADQIITLAHDGSGATLAQEYQPLVDAYAALASIAYVEAPDSVMAVLTRAKHDLARIPPGPSGTNFQTVPVSELRNWLLPFNADQYAGQPLPPMTAAYWRPRPPTSWPPGNGRVSLVVYGGWIMNRCVRSDEGLLRGALYMGYGCQALYSWLPQWVHTYGDRLAITLVAEARGRAIRSLSLSPAQEADSLQWFYRDYLKLPLTVGMIVGSVRNLAAVDGRWRWRDTSFYGNWQQPAQWGEESSQPVVLLYGAGGELRFVGGGGGFNKNLESMVFRRLLEREMQTATRSAGNTSGRVRL